MKKFFLLSTTIPTSYLATASVSVISPPPKGVFTGEATLTISWKESGYAPLIADLTSYVVYLCAGGNEVETFDCGLAVLVDGYRFTEDKGSTTATIPSGAGASSENAYFLQIVSTYPANNSQVINYSARFGLESMNGSFPDRLLSVLNGLEALPTHGPRPSQIPASITMGPYATPYDSQTTGQTRYAPMQPQPRPSLPAPIHDNTAEVKNEGVWPTPAPQWPPSFAGIARTWLPAPSWATTFTHSQTFSVQSRENSAAPVLNPHESILQRWLERWKDTEEN